MTIRPKKIPQSDEKLIRALTEVRKEKKVRLNINVDQSMLKDFRRKTFDQDKTMTGLICGWVKNYLSHSSG